MWKVRLAGYVGGALAVAAAVASALGWGTFDPATGAFDPPPINVYALGGLAMGALTNLVAALALIRGWSSKS